jgi:hypothetical protein
MSLVPEPRPNNSKQQQQQQQQQQQRSNSNNSVETFVKRGPNAPSIQAPSFDPTFVQAFKLR